MERKSPAAWLVLAASVAAGVSYWIARDLALTPTLAVAWKGAGVALLPLYAGLKARNLDGWLICLVMALGALGDVLLETSGLTVGALAFLAGHLVAIGLYLKNRAHRLGGRAWAFLIVPAAVAIAYLLPTDRAMAPGVALYTLGLSLMAACALISRFPLALTGLGALMFVLSDLLIFARAGPWAQAAWIGLAIWGLYYFGQLLICTGVVRTLQRDRRL
ncbi:MULTISPECIES: lysoplasmalogenase family protein [Phenylobacterium]|uniref:Membrane protein YhhN n=1 Tax=Phenylobacterium koreense TaxID=266125 RepID=A0ABV2EFN4_9CAUL